MSQKYRIQSTVKMYSPFWPDEKLPEEANSICDETLARWPSEHNTRKCTAKAKTINIPPRRKAHPGFTAQRVNFFPSTLFPLSLVFPERNLG